MAANPGRGEPRPVRRRTRTFRPNYLSFAGTYRSNLWHIHCGHGDDAMENAYATAGWVAARRSRRVPVEAIPQHAARRRGVSS
jgi:hypothetical protein